MNPLPSVKNKVTNKVIILTGASVNDRNYAISILSPITERAAKFMGKKFQENLYVYLFTCLFFVPLSIPPIKKFCISIRRLILTCCKLLNSEIYRVSLIVEYKLY